MLRVSTFVTVFVFVLLFSLHCAVPDIVLESSSTIGGVCTGGDDGDGECRDPRASGGHRSPNRYLSPSDLPLPQIFDGFDSNTTMSVSGVDLTVLRGSILQQAIQLPSANTNNTDTNAALASNDDTENKARQRSELVVLPSLLPRSVVAEMLELLRGHENADEAGGKTSVVLDSDPDSVDGMTSQEIFLDNDSLRMGQTSKDNPHENMEERRELRQRLIGLTEPYMDILSSFLKEWHGTEKCGRPGRSCTPCYSLIRRYRTGERQSHAPHHDAHSFVTVVVSLTDYGDEYNGGLYVSSRSSERNYVRLNRGDAVAHQADLHHGVRVLDQRDDGGPSERWSWIMWFRDSDTCEDHSHEWYTKCANEGNPACMYLEANHADGVDSKIRWNEKASDAGHAQASVKLAYAYLKSLPSNLMYDVHKARDLFQWAIKSSNEPDGHYGLAFLYLYKAKMTIMTLSTNEQKQQAAIENLGSPLVLKAVYHLEEAAKGGHVFAMFNLGICHTYGYTEKDGSRNFSLAADWFEASGLPEGMFAKSMYLKSIGQTEAAKTYQQKARVLGYGMPWRKPARERTGSGGSGGVKLNMQWPPIPGGQFPPEW